MALVFCLAAAAQAQPGGARGGFSGGFGQSRLSLLRIEAVQKELGLTEDQIAAIRKLSDELRPMGRGGRGGEGGERRGRGRGGNNDRTPDVRVGGIEQYFVQQPGQRRQLSDEERAKMREEAATRAKKEKEEIAKILKPDQLKRLTEIYIQQQGINALNDEDVAKELGINDEQKTKLGKVREEQGAAMRELFGAGGGDREAARTKMADLRKQTEEKTLAVLTDAQKKKFEEMKGKKFDMPEGAGRGGRGGRGGDRPNNN
jgi:hypothetical protein